MVAARIRYTMLQISAVSFNSCKPIFSGHWGQLFLFSSFWMSVDTVTILCAAFAFRYLCAVLVWHGLSDSYAQTALAYYSSCAHTCLLSGIVGQRCLYHRLISAVFELHGSWPRESTVIQLFTVVNMVANILMHVSNMLNAASVSTVIVLWLSLELYNLMMVHFRTKGWQSFWVLANLGSPITAIKCA
jgi:hypothetical protein